MKITYDLHRTHDDFLSWDAVDRVFSCTTPSRQSVTFFRLEFWGLEMHDSIGHEVRYWKPFILSFIANAEAVHVQDKHTWYDVTANYTDANQYVGTKTAYAHLANGTKYEVCRTLQHNLRPAINTFVLIVSPQSSWWLEAQKTVEEMQEKAKQKGWLKVWHEFSWWYPWYRMHVVGKYNGETMIDVGIAVLPFADTGFFPDTQLKNKIDEWFMKILWNVIQGVVATEIALWLGSHLGGIYFAIAIGIYFGYKLGMLWANWNSLENLYVSLVSTVISIGISAWTGLCKFLPASLHALAAGAESIKNVAWAFLCKIIMIPLNIFLLMFTWHRIGELGGV